MPCDTTPVTQDALNRQALFLDMGRAAAYFSYAFVATFEISCYTTDDDVLPILPRRELLTAPDELIKEIRICGIHVNFRQAGALEEAICVCRFDQFSVNCHRMPGKACPSCGSMTLSVGQEIFFPVKALQYFKRYFFLWGPQGCHRSWALGH